MTAFIDAGNRAELCNYCIKLLVYACVLCV